MNVDARFRRDRDRSRAVESSGAMQSSWKSLVGRIEAFAFLEFLVFVTAETSIIFDQDSGRTSWRIAMPEVAAFSAMYFALPWAKRSMPRTALFIVVELLLLALISSQVVGGSTIIVSISVALRNAELLRPPRAYYVTGAMLVVVLAAMTTWGLTAGYPGSVLGGWFLQLALAWGLVSALTSFAASERRANRELRRVASAIAELAAVEERARIAFDLHDQIGHGLTALNVQLEGAIRLLDSDVVRAHALMRSAKDIGSGVLRDVRSTVARLRADPLERDDLDTVLRRICDRYRRDLSMNIECTFEALEGEPVTNTAIARVLEESLINIVRHAHAGVVRVRLWAGRGHRTVEIRDDGVGFDRAENLAGHGLKIMTERAAAANIDLTVDSTPGAGTTIRLTWDAA